MSTRHQPIARPTTRRLALQRTESRLQALRAGEPFAPFSSPQQAADVEERIRQALSALQGV